MRSGNEHFQASGNRFQSHSRTSVKGVSLSDLHHLGDNTRAENRVVQLKNQRGIKKMKS
jgi:hypothetical protein